MDLRGIVGKPGDFNPEETRIETKKPSSPIIDKTKEQMKKLPEKRPNEEEGSSKIKVTRYDNQFDDVDQSLKGIERLIKAKIITTHNSFTDNQLEALRNKNLVDYVAEGHLTLEEAFSINLHSKRLCETICSPIIKNEVIFNHDPQYKNDYYTSKGYGLPQNSLKRLLAHRRELEKTKEIGLLISKNILTPKKIWEISVPKANALTIPVFQKLLLNGDLELDDLLRAEDSVIKDHMCKPELEKLTSEQFKLFLNPDIYSLRLNTDFFSSLSSFHCRMLLNREIQELLHSHNSFEPIITKEAFQQFNTKQLEAILGPNSFIKAVREDVVQIDYIVKHPLEDVMALVCPNPTIRMIFEKESEKHLFFREKPTLLEKYHELKKKLALFKNHNKIHELIKNNILSLHNLLIDLSLVQLQVLTGSQELQNLLLEKKLSTENFEKFKELLKC